jgi:hypothetical protein
MISIKQIAIMIVVLLSSQASLSEVESLQSDKALQITPCSKHYKLQKYCEQHFFFSNLMYKTQS